MSRNIFLTWIAVALALTGSANAGEWKTISEDEAKLRFDAIAPAQTLFRTLWADDWCCRYEFGTWSPQYGEYPRAGLILNELASHTFFKTIVKLKIKNLKMFPFLRDKDINLRDKSQYKGIEYWRFPLSGVECIALFKMFGDQFAGPGEPMAGNKVILGYYCDREIEAVPPILDAISVSDKAERQTTAREAGSSDETESCEPVPADATSRPELKAALFDYYKQHPIRRSPTYGYPLTLESIEKMRVLNTSGSVLTIEVKYRARKAYRGTATVEACGSNYKVLSFK